MNLFQIGLKTIKQQTDETHKRESVKLKSRADYEKQTIEMFFLFSDSNEVFASGAVPMSEDPNSVKAAEMIIAGVKKQLSDYKKPVRIVVEFDLLKLEIERVELYYLNKKNEKLKFIG